ncbi:MAG: glycoside hydrolase family 5 protein [Opitutaceae bacterium]|jgi:endoglucanase
MKTYTPFVCVLLALATGLVAGEPVESIQAANARLGRGINLANALEAPKEGEWGVTLQPEYFKIIREAGFYTVRLPVRWSAHALKEPPYTIDPAFAARVDWAIDQATSNRLNIVINLHNYEEMDKDPDANQERLAALWTQIAERYRNRPASVYFEFYNEPHGKLTSERWNAVIPVLLKAVRASNPYRPVIIGPGSWNSINSLDALRLPPEERRVIVTVHFYDPFEFTHQGASWVTDADKWKDRHWTGSDDEKTTLRTSLEKAARWGRVQNRPIFLGEFGAYSTGDMESRARWTRFVAGQANRLSLSWAYWEFCSGFGAYDPQAKAWREPLKAALLEMR